MERPRPCYNSSYYREGHCPVTTARSSAVGFAAAEKPTRPRPPYPGAASGQWDQRGERESCEPLVSGYLRKLSPREWYAWANLSVPITAVISGVGVQEPSVGQ